MLNRTESSGAVDERLFFAQVREDPRLELEAFAAHLDGPIAVVSSGGCTALSLVAAGADTVIGVDLNRSQNHLVELKAAAVATLGPQRACSMLGGSPLNPALRLSHYDDELREQLTLGARRYWDARRKAVARGVLGAGSTERAMRAAMIAFRATVHRQRRIDRLLALSTTGERQAFFDAEWNTARWRGMFKAMFNRTTMNKTYDPAFFAHVGKISFADHFQQIVERTITELPVRDNYFLHYLAREMYPVDESEGVPLYLAKDYRDGSLELVDGSFADYLRTRPDSSMSGFSLSNICEWLDAGQIDELFGEIVRTAAPGARLCLRNFVGWTEVPVQWRAHVVEDRSYGEKLMLLDRSMVQRRFAVCDIHKEV